MRTYLLACGILLMGGCLSQASAQQPAESGAEGYVWADACKACHGAIYDAWHDTKHARTFTRLSAADREGTCVGCHVTGPKQVVMEGGTPVNANVQCESCHGPGRAHVEAATGGSAKPGHIVASPGQALCESCHNDRSPHYRGFFFNALKGLVHKVPK